MGVFKKAAAALGLNKADSSDLGPGTGLAAGQARVSSPNLHLGDPTMVSASPAYRGSGDGRLSAHQGVTMMKGMYGPLDSPKGSSCGIRSTQTGGGHGEAPPTNPGAPKQLTSPLHGRYSSSSIRELPSPAPQCAASPLARQVANRNMANRKATDGATPTLPTLMSGGSFKGRDPTSSPLPIAAPAPPVAPVSPTSRPPPEASPRARRASTFTDAPAPPMRTSTSSIAAVLISPLGVDRERFRGLTIQQAQHDPAASPHVQHAAQAQHLQRVPSYGRPHSPGQGAQSPTQVAQSPVASPTAVQRRASNNYFKVDLNAAAAAAGVAVPQPQTPPVAAGRPSRTALPAPSLAEEDDEDDLLPVRKPPTMKTKEAEPLPEQPAPSTMPEFRPRTMPAEGLLHLSAHAPAAMRAREGPWTVGDYKVVRKLYAGYASSVYKAECLHTGSDVVLKAYNIAGLSQFLKHQVLRELDIHSRLHHPGIVHLLAAFREGETLVLVLDYVRGGSLDRVRRKLGGRMTEFQAMHLVLLPLLGTLLHLHEKGIVHRDIKPENCLFTDDWQLKLCDYGVSVCLAEERAVTRTGSREYMAPEVNICPLKRGPEDNKDNEEMAYSLAVDTWSLGAMLYELLVGFTPFPGGPPPARPLPGAAPPSAALAFPGGISARARDFIKSCLEINPSDRPTVRQLLMHPWVQSSLEESAQGQSAPAGA